MRFFVHVTPIGKVDTQSYCVEADSWQKALQSTRTMRGETAPITGFSIELTDEGGCRAVDPGARLRYVVKRAPDTAILTGAQGPISTSGGRASDASISPRISDASASARISDSSGNRPGAQTIGYGMTGAHGVRNSSVDARERSGSFSGSSSGPISSPPNQIPAGTDATQAGMQVVTEDPHVLYRREQEPTDESPLLYREDVYVMPKGTTEAQAEKYLRAQFLTIKAVLASSKPGKYVNLAVFDQTFEGRPPVPPLATLSWKDWKGQEPTVVYPRTATAAVDRVSRTSERPSRKSDEITVAPVLNIAAVLQESERTAVPPQAPQATQAFPAPRAPEPPTAPAGPAAPPAPAPLVEHAPVQVAGGRPSADPLGVTVIAAAPPRAASEPAFPAPGVPAQKPAAQMQIITPEPFSVSEIGLTPSDGRVSVSGRISNRPSRPSVNRLSTGGRLRGDELIAVLFESMHDLHFSRDALEAAEFCLQLAMENIPSRAALAHFYDVDKREYVIVAAVGAGLQPLVLRAHPMSDSLLTAAMRKRAAVVVPNVAASEHASIDRFELIGGAKSVIVAPVMLLGRALAAIELVNPTDGAPYTDAEGNALTYMGEQFAEYVSSHGLVLDRERIGRHRSE